MTRGVTDEPATIRPRAALAEASPSPRALPGSAHAQAAPSGHRGAEARAVQGVRVYSDAQRLLFEQVRVMSLWSARAGRRQQAGFPIDLGTNIRGLAGVPSSPNLVDREMAVDREIVAAIEEEVAVEAVQIVTCGGCRSQSYASAFSRYRSKVWCGSDACRSIIDSRRRAQNRRKKMNRKERGVFYKGVTSRIRHHVLQRDELSCALCGSSTRFDLQVHHIRPRSEDGSDRHTNLITLCKEDHDMVHRNMDRYRVSLSCTAIRREVDHMLSARQVARRRDQAIRRRRRESEEALRRCGR